MSQSDSSSHNGEDSDPTTGSSPGTHDNYREVYRTAARDLGRPIACAKLPKGKTAPDDHQILVNTNIHGVRMNPKIPVYQYHVNLMKRHIDKNSGNSVEYLVFDPTGVETDYFKVNRRRMASKVLNVLCDTYPEFGSPDNFVYDSANTLYTFKPFPKGRKDYEIDENLSTEWLGRKNQIFLRIVNVSDPVSFDVKDFSHITRDFHVYNQEVIRFLELATSHYSINHSEEHIMYNNTATYFMDPSRYGYTPADTRDLNNGKYISVGASKNVLSIEGPTMRAAAAVSVDSRKVLFYHTGSLVDIICRLCEIRNVSSAFDNRNFTKVNSFVKRLVCHRTYGNFGGRTVVLQEMRPMTADTHTITIRTGETVTIQQYLRDTYQVELEFPHWPMVCEIGRNKEYNYYPVETLRVADFQRVGGGTTPDDIREIIRSTAVAPAVKQIEVERSCRSFSFDKNMFLKSLGVSVMEKPIVVSARLLTAPSITYGNGEEQPQVNGTWRINKAARFIKPSKLSSWAAVLIEGGTQTNFDEFKAFAKMFYHELVRRGVEMPQPIDVLIVSADRESLRDMFNSALNLKCKFLLLGHPDKENTLHGDIKSLERSFGILTQCVKVSTLAKVAAQRSPLTLENLAMKANVKFGGLNYGLKLKSLPIDEKVLFIGFGMSLPAGGLGAPAQDDVTQAATIGTAKRDSYSVVGYAANDNENHDEFTGNFLLQPAFRDEKVVVSQVIFEDVFTRYLRNHKNQPPSRVILYRNGCTEGQFGDILRYELPHLRHAMKHHFKMGTDTKIPLTVIVPSKVHSVRFFNSTINRQDKPMDQNICPGVVIDSAVTHSAFCEFYLNSHRAIQGTAKTPKYSIIYNDDPDATLDMFERWTNALCYDFQIVNSPTSLPAPVYIANRYAERGRMLLNCYDHSSSNREQRLAPPLLEADGNHEDEDSGSGSGNSVANDLLNEHFYVQSLQINYTELPEFRKCRINA